MTHATERLSAALADRYRIERALGQGGMATVYLAEDLKHKRRVAVKVLKPELAAVLGAERFVQEITTTAALQHPHILPLFDSGEADGFLYYVMPFIDGETLRAKLDRDTQLGIDEAVRIATDVASALHYAHTHGVIHRDIKPENILLHDGRPMVADFGIALALSAAAGGRMTETGLSLGTPHYMSPEQATAEKDITARADQYALASVLYEMLTGDPPHTGATAQQIIMRIITEEAQDVTARRKTVPRAVADALAQALQKLPADRFASTAEFAAALGNTALSSHASGARRDGHGTGSRDVATWRRLALASGGALLLALAALVIVSTRRGGTSAPPQLVRVSLPFPGASRWGSYNSAILALSRDGSMLAFMGDDEGVPAIWLREIESLSARLVPGSTGGSDPFFSPDGRRIAYVQAPSGGTTMLLGSPTSGQLRTLAVEGGVPRTLVTDSLGRLGGDWGSDGFIYFPRVDGRIARVPENGGATEVIGPPSDERQSLAFPQLLPDGKTLLVHARRPGQANALALLDIATGALRPLFDALNGRYLDSGRILYADATGALFAVPFDASRGRVTGAPTALGDVGRPRTNFVMFTAAPSGTLLYQPASRARDQLVWVDREGRATPIDSAWRGTMRTPVLSPDGARVALSMGGPNGTQVWVRPLPTGPRTLVSFGGSINWRPRWAPDGSRVHFLSGGGPDGTALVSRRFDAGDAGEVVLAPTAAMSEIEWLPDRRSLIIRTGSLIGTRDLMQFTPGVDSAPRALLVSGSDEYGPAVSPDGRWLAYLSTETGRAELYVRRIDDLAGARAQVSVDGATVPVWARSGREIFWRGPDGGTMFASTVRGGASFAADPPRLLFRQPDYQWEFFAKAFDISLDDRRFLMVSTAESERDELVLVLGLEAAIRAAGRGSP
jgi:eukaryotic-like serine/threonine-protein kinase